MTALVSDRETTTTASRPMDVENVYATNNRGSDHEEAASDNKDEPTTAAASDDAVVFSPELLQLYYARLFPFSLMHSWLSYGGYNPMIFSHREFSMTIENSGEEIYIRYQSFSSQEELQQAILKRRPCKIDIGAVFERPPKDKKLSSAKPVPVQRELVFDIDLTDYDQVRRCGCSGAKICPICWKYMNMAVRIMDEGLREDFGFQHIAWFYSGRRGIHAWICDEAARELTDQGRSAVAKYFEIDMGSDRNSGMKLWSPLHPMLERAFKILEPMFIDCVIPASGHGLLATPESCQEILDSLPDTAAEVKENLTKANWTTSSDSPKKKWIKLNDHLRAFLKGSSKSGMAKASKGFSTKERTRLEHWPMELVFKNTYPRLDISVSKTRNHLLKSPFCVHPKTGRVCVPIQAKDVDNFDPFDVPTLSQLARELDAAHEKDAGSEEENNENSQQSSSSSTSRKNSTANWQKTSLKKYFEPFQKEFLEPLLRDLRRQQREVAEQQAVVTGDF